MAWNEPKITWSDADLFTASDINRINGNVQYLLTHGEPTKTYTENDIITLGEYQQIKTSVILLSQITGLIHPDITNDVTADNFNKLETLINDLKIPVDRRYNMVKSNKYAGSFYTGSYVRSGGR